MPSLGCRMSCGTGVSGVPTVTVPRSRAIHRRTTTDEQPPISATITVDGKVVKTGKSSGAYAIVSVNESIGTLGK